MAIQWLWLAVRFRSLTLPSVANPDIVAGGLVGEGKMDAFRSMGPLARAYTAPACAIAMRRDLGVDEITAHIAAAGLAFPVVVKPDLGLCGYGVRKTATLAELVAYLAGFPVGETAVIQAYIAAEEEAGIFYVRHPGQARGRIIGLALRYFPRVIGDGRRSISALIDADPRARRVRSVQHAVGIDQTRIPALGELVRLATIGSTRVGGLYRDGTHLVTAELTQVVDAIAADMPRFHFGRFDVRFTSFAELSTGRGFSLLESVAKLINEGNAR